MAQLLPSVGVLQKKASPIFTGDAKYGFAIENLDIYSQNCDDKLSKLGVYCIFVTKEDLRKIKINLSFFMFF